MPDGRDRRARGARGQPAGVMQDFFALLGQPRNPWLDADTLKGAFVAAAAGAHPDRLHNAPAAARNEAHARYTVLNQAHLCLKDPRSRLRHLLELERGSRVRDLQEIPEDLVVLFTRLNAQLKEADQHLQEAANTASPLLRVTLFAKGEELRQGLQETQGLLDQRLQELETRLRSLGDRWTALSPTDAAARETLLTELEVLYRLFSFHVRWREQVGTRALRLMEQA